MDFCYIFIYFFVVDFFDFFSEFLIFFRIFLDFFSPKLLRLLLNFKEVTTEHQKWPKISTNSSRRPKPFSGVRSKHE